MITMREHILGVIDKGLISIVAEATVCLSEVRALKLKERAPVAPLVPQEIASPSGSALV